MTMNIYNFLSNELRKNKQNGNKKNVRDSLIKKARLLLTTTEQKKFFEENYNNINDYDNENKFELKITIDREQNENKIL